MIHEVMGQISCAIGKAKSTPTIAVKLSPYSDPHMIGEVAKVINEFKRITSIVTSNTFPNALPLTHDGTQKCISGQGYAGMSGVAFKEIVLGQVRQFIHHLRGDISITGVGGIQTGDHIRQHLAAGASDVQIGAACWVSGPRVIQDAVVDDVNSL
jgi:dihydroorotate dehydrogenase